MYAMMLAALLMVGECNNECIKIKAITHFGYTYTQDANHYGLPLALLLFSGSPLKNVSFLFGYKINVNSLLICSADLKFKPYLSFRLGRFKIPFAQEFIAYPVRHMTPNFTGITKTVLAELSGQHFDEGIMLYGGLPYVKYNMGIVEGDDNLNNKNIVGGLTVNPHKMISLGAEVYVGKFTHGDTIIDTSDLNMKDFYLTLMTPYAGLKGEYIMITSGDVNKAGYIATLFAPIALPWEGFTLIPTVKYSMVDPNTDAEGDALTEIHVGTSLTYAKKIRTMLFYEIHQEETNEVDNNQFVAQIQFFF